MDFEELKYDVSVGMNVFKSWAFKMDTVILVRIVSAHEKPGRFAPGKYGE